MRRVAFSEEYLPGEWVQVYADGDIGADLLDAMEAFIVRHRKRIAVRRLADAAAPWFDPQHPINQQ
jgi:hypothetical protein